MLPYLYKALGLALQEKDVALERTLLECYELLGRYVLPDTYVPLIEPRLKEDPLETPNGLDEKQKAVVLLVLQAMTEGSRPKELFRHLPTLVGLDTEEDAELGDFWRASAVGLVSLLLMVKGRGKAAVETHFLSTGRLTTLTTTFYRAFRYVMLCRGRGKAFEGEGALVGLADQGLDLLQGIEEEDHSVRGPSALVWRYGPRLVQETIGEYLVGPMWSPQRVPHLLLDQMLRWDPSFLYDRMVPLVDMVCRCLAAAESAEASEEVLILLLGSWLACRLF